MVIVDCYKYYCLTMTLILFSLASLCFFNYRCNDSISEFHIQHERNEHK